MNNYLLRHFRRQYQFKRYGVEEHRITINLEVLKATKRFMYSPLCLSVCLPVALPFEFRQGYSGPVGSGAVYRSSETSPACPSTPTEPLQARNPYPARSQLLLKVWTPSRLGSSETRWRQCRVWRPCLRSPFCWVSRLCPGRTSWSRLWKERRVTRNMQ